MVLVVAGLSLSEPVLLGCASHCKKGQLRIWRGEAELDQTDAGVVLKVSTGSGGESMNDATDAEEDAKDTRDGDHDEEEEEEDGDTVESAIINNPAREPSNPTSCMRKEKERLQNAPQVILLCFANRHEGAEHKVSLEVCDSIDQLMAHATIVAETIKTDAAAAALRISIGDGYGILTNDLNTDVKVVVEAMCRRVPRREVMVLVEYISRA